MPKERAKILAAKISLAFALSISAFQSANAGIPVADATNLTQNVMTAMEEVSQTAKQISQYETQLEQYQNMLQNTTAPAAYIWDQAQTTIKNLTDATNTLANYQNELGSLDAYLGRFQDVAYYRNSPCFTATGCSDTERAVMEQNRRLASESQKRANDAMFKSLDQQQTNLEADAKQLNRLQSAAQGADGQLAAIGYANQLASNQANQLLQIRSLLIAQQNAVAARMQADADKEAQYEASHERLFDMGELTDRSKNKDF